MLFYLFLRLSSIYDAVRLLLVQFWVYFAIDKLRVIFYDFLINNCLSLFFIFIFMFAFQLLLLLF